MWLKICFFPDKPGLLAAMGRDGTVYFKASEVGKFLGYTSPYKFAKDHARTNLIHKVPPHMLSWSKLKVGGVLVFDFEEMMTKIEALASKCKRNLEDDVRLMKSLWKYGFVSNVFPDSVPRFYKEAFELKIENVNNVPVQEWLLRYAEKTMALFDDEESKLYNNFMDVESPQTFESNPIKQEPFEYLNENAQELNIENQPLSEPEKVDVEREIFRNLKKNILMLVLDKDTGLKIVYDNLKDFPSQIHISLKGTTRVYT